MYTYLSKCFLVLRPWSTAVAKGSALKWCLGIFALFCSTPSCTHSWAWRVHDMPGSFLVNVCVPVNKLLIRLCLSVLAPNYLRMGVQGLKQSLVSSSDQFGLCSPLCVLYYSGAFVGGKSINCSTSLGEQLSFLLVLDTGDLAGTAVIDSFFHIKKLRKTSATVISVSICVNETKPFMNPSRGTTFPFQPASS